MRALAPLVALVLAVAWPALAEAPSSSPRPVARPGTEAAAPATRSLVARPTTAAEAPADSDTAAATPGGEARPERRPGGFLAALRRKPNERDAPTPAPDPTVVASGGAASASTAVITPDQRPEVRPKGLGRLFGRAAQPAPKRYPLKGSICNDRSIRGTEIGKVNGRGACGISNAVKVTEVGGVKLSTAATVDCNTAQRLNAWVQNVASPAVGRRGGGLSEIKVLAHYACRTRNNRPGAKLSEHAKGRAIDIGAFSLADGSSFNVLRGWRDGTYGPILKTMHKGACGRFGTVLGPNADRYHQDHFHFDTAQYRSGSYCR